MGPPSQTGDEDRPDPSPTNTRRNSRLDLINTTEVRHDDAGMNPPDTSFHSTDIVRRLPDPMGPAGGYFFCHLPLLPSLACLCILGLPWLVSYPR